MSERRAILDEAASLVDGDRNAQYGDPRQDFRRTAGMWAAYLGVEIAPHDVAAMMCLLKVSRVRWSPTKRDSWVDLAGYAACGWDCAKPDALIDPPLDLDVLLHQAKDIPKWISAHSCTSLAPTPALTPWRIPTWR